MNIINHLKKLDWVMVAAAVLLACIGLASIYSSSLGRGDFLNFEKQLIFFGSGLIFMFLLSFLDWRALREESYLVLALYVLSVMSLIGLFFFAPEIRGIKAWYKIGQFSFDPIEFIKIILIILLAKYFATRHIEMYRIRHILLSGLYVFLPAGLIFLQPNLGSVLVLLCLWIGMLVVSGIPLRHFLFLVFCFGLIFIISWSFVLKEYQKDRIISFIVPQLEPLGMSWSQNQAEIAIGSGGFLGQGLGHGSQTQYRFLPEPQTDFIFAALAEETGLAGISVIFFLFLLLVWRIMKIAKKAQANFPRLFAAGFSVLLVSEIFINIGMNIGILPIIGIPLPLISYGGSGLLAIFIGLGILQSIKSH